MGCDWRRSIHFVGFCIFCGQSVVAIIMIDGSKTRTWLVGVKVQSLYVIERHRNIISLNAHSRFQCPKVIRPFA